MFDFHGNCEYVLARGKMSRTDTFAVIVRFGKTLLTTSPTTAQLCAMWDERGDLLEGDHCQGWQRIPPGADQAEEGKRGDGCKVEQEKTDLQRR